MRVWVVYLVEQYRQLWVECRLEVEEGQVQRSRQVPGQWGRVETAV